MERGMASAHRYSWTRKDGSIGRAWRAKWVGADGKPSTRRGFKREGDAIAYAVDREVEARHGLTLTDSPGAQMTLESWSQQWLESQAVRPSTRRGYEVALRRICKSLGQRPLAGIRRSEIRAWQRGLESEYASSTASNTARLLAIMFRAAVEDGLLERSPMPRGYRQSSHRAVDPNQLLTLKQVAAWDAAMPKHARGMVIVAASTGLRQSELLGLLPGDVDFLRGRIHVVRQLSRDPGSDYVPPKTAAGVRTVPLAAVAREALAAHLAAYPPVEGEPIYRGARGRRWDHAVFGKAALAARRAAKLPDWATWHTLRDVMASALIRGGVDVRSVMVILGHGSAEVTLQTYARLWPDAQEAAQGSLDRVFAATPPGARARV